MWYYELNHQAVGPVSQDEMVDLLQKGTINALTLVWKEGMADWRHLGETELSPLANQTAQRPSAGFPYTTSPAQSPASQPVVISPANNRHIRAAGLRWLFTWWTGVVIFLSIYQLISILSPNSTLLVSLSCLDLIAALAEVVLMLVLLYRFWQINQDGASSTTPGKAVGFLFLPFFNYYWIFRAYCGLAIDQARYIRQHFNETDQQRIPKSHLVIPIVTLVTFLAGGIWEYVLLANKFAAMNITTFDMTAFNNLMSQVAVPFGIFTLILSALLLLMYYDFYHCALGILQNQDNPQ